MSDPYGTGLSALLGLRPSEAVAVVGAGGKTSVIDLLAAENSARRVLIMPTTKIHPPKNATRYGGTPKPGVQYAGAPLPHSGKLAAPPQAEWAALAAGFDLTLMEADGSRGLPCKGWADHEPVVPDFATRTLGVLTTAGLGRPADEATVLRLPEFLHLTGLAPGAAITMEALAAMAGASAGMFKAARGQRLLLINRVEDAAALEQAKTLAGLIGEKYPGRVQRFLAGSAHRNQWLEL